MKKFTGFWVFPATYCFSDIPVFSCVHFGSQEVTPGSRTIRDQSTVAGTTHSPSFLISKLLFDRVALAKMIPVHPDGRKRRFYVTLTKTLLTKTSSMTNTTRSKT